MKDSLFSLQTKSWEQGREDYEAGTIKEYLVQWKDFPSEETTWEYEKIFQHPKLELIEDK